MHPTTALGLSALLVGGAVLVPLSCDAAPPQPSTSCSACTAVARALSTRLASEGQRNDLDWRGRVGPDGSRSGVRLAYAESEQRLDDLLEGLCSTDGLTDGSAWWNGPGGGGGRWAAKGEAPPEGWGPPAARAERESRAKELENFCGRLVEAVEDDLADALFSTTTKSGGVDVGAVLCERLTRHCPPGASKAGGSGRRGEEL